MARRTHRAFTLQELLVVVLVLGVLVAMVVPALEAIWGIVRQVECKINLANLYVAQQAYQSQQVMNGGSTDSTEFATGAGWQALLAPFIEGSGTFLCPQNQAYWDGTDISGNTTGGTRPPLNVPGTVELRFYQRNQVGASVDVGYNVGDYRWTISIPDGGVSVRTIPMGDHLRVQVDDCIAYGAYAYDDYWFDLYLDPSGKPSRLVKVLTGGDNFGTEGPDSQFRYRPELWVGSTQITDDWTAEPGGTTIDLSAIQGSSGWSDYGLSRGVYDRPLDPSGNPMDIGGADSKLIMILDYPFPIADYTGIDVDDDWNKIFITNIAQWRATYKHSDTDLDWYAYQALRHSGRANVLFCDGRVDDLGPEDLLEANPLWRYLGVLSGAERSAISQALQVQASSPPSPLQSVTQPAATSAGQAAPAAVAAQAPPAPKAEGRAPAVVPGPGPAPPPPVKVPAPDLPRPRWVPGKQEVGRLVTFHWNGADCADVYLNGWPLRSRAPDFHRRQGEAEAELSADAVIRRGDVITVGARRGAAFGFLLVAVDRDRKVVWKTDPANWKAYVPGGEKKWAAPDVAARFPAVPVTVPPTVWPPQAALNARFGNRATPIWCNEAPEVFLISVILDVGGR